MPVLAGPVKIVVDIKIQVIYVFHRRVFRVRVRDAGYYFILNAHKGKIVWGGAKKEFIRLIINLL